MSPATRSRPAFTGPRPLPRRWPVISRISKATTAISGPIACRPCWAESRRCGSPFGWARPLVPKWACWRRCCWASRVLLTAEASIATTDAVLLAAVTGTMGVLMRIYRAAKEDLTVPTRLVVWGWISFAIAVLVKGPVVVGVAGASVMVLLAWDWWDARPRKPAVATPAESGAATSSPPMPPAPLKNIFLWLKGTRPLLGVPLVLVIAAPWTIAIWVESHGSFFSQSLGHDFAGKLVSGQESHGLPPGYNILLSAVTLWPGILFVLPAIGLAVTRAREPAIRFLLAWAGGFWLVCEACADQAAAICAARLSGLGDSHGLVAAGGEGRRFAAMAPRTAVYFRAAIFPGPGGAGGGAHHFAQAVWRRHGYGPSALCDRGGTDRAGRAVHGGDGRADDRAGSWSFVACHYRAHPDGGRRARI